MVDCGPRIELTDTTGLVESCIDAGKADYRQAEPHLDVTGPNLNVLELWWGTPDCATTWQIGIAAGSVGIVVAIDDGPHVPCAGNPSARSVEFHLSHSVLARDFIVLHDGLPMVTIAPPANPPVITPSSPPTIQLARWEIAPDEHPKLASTSVRIIVFENACASGASPEGRIWDPFVYPGRQTIQVLIPVMSLPGPQTCVPAPGAPYTLELGEPLGYRSLGSVYEPAGDLGVFRSNRGEQMALERVQALAGPGACITELNFDPGRLTTADVERIAGRRQHGWVDGHRAYVGSWTDAAQVFGGIEAYQDGQDVFRAVLALARDIPVDVGAVDDDVLELAPLDGFWTPDGRQVWYPARFRTTLIDPAPCATGR